MAAREIDLDLLDQLNRKVSILGATIEGACSELSDETVTDGLRFGYQELTDTVSAVNNTSTSYTDEAH